MKYEHFSIMTYHSRLVSLFVIGISLASLYMAAHAQTPVKSAVIVMQKALKGDELLIEATDRDGESGIYSLDCAKSGSSPLLLESGAAYPLWSPKHQKIFFLKDDHAYIKQIDGYTFVWSQDRVLGRYSKLSGYGQGKIFWDLSGKLDMISYWPSFGERLDRSIGIKENFIFKQPPIRVRGFLDTIIPLDSQGNPLAIHAASVSPDETKVVVQLYPATPFGVDLNKSQIRMYDTFYRLGKENIKLWEDAQKVNQSGFVSDQSVPQLYAKSVPIGGTPNGCLDINPNFSMTGRFISMDRVNLSDGSMKPIVVNVNSPVKYQELNISKNLLNEKNLYPREVRGWPSYYSLEWTNKDQLWLMSGRSEMVYIASQDSINENWKVKNIIGEKSNHGVISHFAIFNNLMAVIYNNQSQRIYIYDSDTTDGHERFIDLPEGMSVKTLDW